MNVEKNKRLTHIYCILCLMLSFFIPAFFLINFTLNHFYVHGGYVLDSGWFAYLSTHATSFPMSNPPIMHGSYFSIHFSPIFYLYTGIHELLFYLGLNLSSPVFFSITQGIWFGLLSLACFIIFLPKKNERKNGHIFLAFMIALFSILNGISLSVIGYPHFEIGIPAMLLVFFALWLKGFKKSSLFPLFLGLLIREDAGLHYFGIFFLLTIYFYFSNENKKNIGYANSFLYLAIVCLGYAISVIIVQRIFWGHNALSRIYLGDPIFGHVNWPFIKQRAHDIIYFRTFIYIPLILLLILAVFRKNLFLLLGFVTVIPWLLLSFFAISNSAGTLKYYYAYPILFGLFWPVIIYGFQNIAVQKKRSYYSYWCDASMLLIISLLCYTGMPHINLYPIRNFNFQWVHHVKHNQEILDSFLEKDAHNARFIVDTAVAAIELDKIKSKNMCTAASKSTITDLNKLDFAIIKPNAFGAEAVALLIEKAGLTNQCQLHGTSFILATKSDDPLKLCIKYQGRI